MTSLVCWEKNKREKTSINQSEQKEEKRGKREKNKRMPFVGRGTTLLAIASVPKTKSLA